MKLNSYVWGGCREQTGRWIFCSFRILIRVKNKTKFEKIKITKGLRTFWLIIGNVWISTLKVWDLKVASKLFIAAKSESNAVFYMDFFKVYETIVNVCPNLTNTFSAIRGQA